MEHKHYYFRSSFYKKMIHILNSFIQVLPLVSILINLLVFRYAYSQSKPLTGEMLEVHPSFAEWKANFSWSTAFDELRTMADSDETKNTFTKEMAKIFVEVITYENPSIRGISDDEEKGIVNDLEKIYFETIHKMRNGLVNADDVDHLKKKMKDHLMFFGRSRSRINRVVGIISEIQSADDQYEKDPFFKSLRRELKSLLQEALDKKGNESEEFKFYQELLNSNPRTKLILDRNNKEALSNKLKKIQKKLVENRETRKVQREILVDKIKGMSDRTKLVDTLGKDPLFEKLNSLKDSSDYILNSIEYLPLKTKMYNLETRLNSKSEYSFKKETSYSSAFQINKNVCNEISFNNISNMGPDSNQKSTGTCWAHASAALIEEQLCLAHPEHCGKRVARTYIIGKTRGIEFFGDGMSQGENPLSVLSYFTNPFGGNFDVCLDSYSRNPLNLEEFEYSQYLLQEYYLIKMKQKRGHCSTQLQRELADLLGHWRELLDFLKDDGISTSKPNHYLSREAFEQLVAESSSVEEFIQKVLLFPCTQTNQKVNFRRDPEQHLVSIDFLVGQNVHPFVDMFRDAKSYHHSVLLSVCFNSFLLALRHSEEASVNSRPNECVLHAIVVNAVQWNSVENRCEIHLKNSHGQYASAPSGWYPAEILFNNTKKATYFGSD